MNQFQYLKGMEGGADDFYRFLKDEALPELDRKYSTQPYRVLVGHSLGGLFAFWCAGRPDSPFRSCIAISPAMKWNGGESLKAISEALSKKAMKSDVFLALGEQEDYDAAAFHQAEDVLLTKRYESWRGKSQMFSGMDHGTVALPAFQAGLEFAFPGWRLQLSSMKALSA